MAVPHKEFHSESDEARSEEKAALEQTALSADSETGPSPVRWGELVERIQMGDPRGMEELYRLFSRGIRFYLCRQLGPQELDDKVHDTFVIVVQAIQRGDLREPDRLMGFVRTVVRRQIAAHIDSAVHNRRDFEDLDTGAAVYDRRATPEERVISRQEMEIMEAVLRSVSVRDREILTRFYLMEQPQQQICEAMNLTETQFRLLKSRAKARFGELGRRRLKHRTFPKVSLRKLAGTGH